MRPAVNQHTLARGRPRTIKPTVYERTLHKARVRKMWVLGNLVYNEVEIDPGGWCGCHMQIPGQGKDEFVRALDGQAIVQLAVEETKDIYRRWEHTLDPGGNFLQIHPGEWHKIINRTNEPIVIVGLIAATDVHGCDSSFNLVRIPRSVPPRYTPEKAKAAA